MRNHDCRRLPLMIALGLLTWAPTALGHIGVSGQAYAGKTTLLSFAVGHGCSGSDTFEIELKIPEGITTVRAMPHPAFTDVQVVTDDAGLPQTVVFHKDPASVHATDDLFYQLGLRVSLPDTPFAKLYFPATQRCRSATGEDLVVEWIAMEADHDSDEPPAPALIVLPEHGVGWHEFTTGVVIDDLSTFKDAEIVWLENRAYSAQPTLSAQIEAEDDVELLESIPAGASFWVKY